MTIIYCVQSATDLNGANGYSNGLLEAGHPKVLVSFLDYMTRHQELFKGQVGQRQPGKKVARRSKTLNVKRKP